MSAIGYFYDNEFKYIGSGILQINPKSLGAYLVPANCTQVQPPNNYTVEEVPVYNTDSKTWSIGNSKLFYENQEFYKTAMAAYDVPLYEQNIEGVWIERPQSEIDNELNLVNQERKYDSDLENLKNNMDEKIIAKAFEITHASTSESAAAFMQAYQVRSMNPSQYSSDGLKVLWAVDSYNLGDSLDTELKITEYYTKVLIYIDKFRESEIGVYLAAKAALDAV